MLYCGSTNVPENRSFITPIPEWGKFARVRRNGIIPRNLETRRQRRASSERHGPARLQRDTTPSQGQSSDWVCLVCRDCAGGALAAPRSRRVLRQAPPREKISPGFERHSEDAYGRSCRTCLPGTSAASVRKALPPLSFPFFPSPTPAPGGLPASTPPRPPPPARAQLMKVERRRCQVCSRFKTKKIAKIHKSPPTDYPSNPHSPVSV